MALIAARIFVGLWLIVSTAQWFVAATIFAEDGPLAFARIARVGRKRLVGAWRRRMSVAALRTWLAVQLVLAILLLAGVAPLPVGAALLASYGALLLLSGDYWSDGSDKIGMIVLAGTLLTGIGVARDDALLALAGVLVAGGQLTLCYAIAGWSKVIVVDWRSGAELRDIMATDLWGTTLVRRVTGHPTGALVAAWGVMGIEMIFPLALLAPLPWLAGALAVMLAFHIATALIMRLNLFPWAFVSAFPAVILLSRAIRAGLGWTP